MMLRKTITNLVLIFSICLIGNKSMAQMLPFTNADINEVETAKRNKTYVVLNKTRKAVVNVEYEKIEVENVTDAGNRDMEIDKDDTGFNQAMKEAFKTFWKFGEYEFIDYDEFETARLDPEKSFVFIHSTKEMLGSEKIYFGYLVYALGSKKARTKPEKMPWVASIPLTYGEISDEYYNYKLGMLVQFLQTHTDLILDTPGYTNDDVIKNYNKRSSEIKDYTLYVLQEDLTEKVYDLDDIEKVYPYDVYIVSQKEIKEMIYNKKDDALFLHKAGPEKTNLEFGTTRKFIMSLKGGEIYYMSEDYIRKKSPEGFLESDFKKIAK